MPSMVMRRILGIESKNRKQVRARLESELIIALKANGMDTSDTLNLALENYLAQKKMVSAQ